MSKRKYFDNNWEAINDAPSEVFEPCEWEIFHDWRLCYWELPSTVACIIRAKHKETGKVSEHVYRQTRAAKRKLFQLCQEGDYEITIADHDSISKVDARPDTD